MRNASCTSRFGLATGCGGFGSDIFSTYKLAQGKNEVNVNSNGNMNYFDENEPTVTANYEHIDKKGHIFRINDIVETSVSVY